MKRRLSWFLLFLMLWMHIPVGLVQAQSESAPADPLPIDPNFRPSKNDEEFSGRSATGEKWTFKKIPRDLGLSMKESFWGWGSLAFALGAGLSGGLYASGVDDDLNNSFQEGALFTNTGNTIIGWTLSPYTIGGVSLITFLVAHNTGHPKLATTTLAMTEAIFLSMSINAIGKVAFRRERPDGGNFSFPSGHATAAFSAAGVLTTMYGWKAGIPSYALASLVSISRIDDKEHFLSDVVMGAVLGTVIGVGTAKFHKKENPNFFFNGSASRDGASLGFTYIY